MGKQVIAASYSDKWCWPSDMHKYAGENAVPIGALAKVMIQKAFGR